MSHDRKIDRTVFTTIVCIIADSDLPICRIVIGTLDIPLAVIYNACTILSIK